MAPGSGSTEVEGGAGSPMMTLSRIDAVPSPRFPRRFGARVFFYILTLAVGFSVASTAVFYWRQLGFIDRDRARRSKTLLTSLATEVELGAYAGDAGLCELPARRTASEEDVVFVAIYDRRGREILHYVRRGISLPPPPTAEVLGRLGLGVDGLPPTFAAARQAALDYDDLYAPIVTLGRDPAVAIATGPARAPVQPEVVGLARLGLSHHFEDQQLRETVRWGLLLGAGILAVGVAAAVLISRRVARPIAAVIRGAELLRLGDLEARVRVESRDELGQVAYAFNRMARRLNESVTALEDLNRDLEAEVARRTVEVQRAADFSALLNAPLGRRDILPDYEPAARILGGAAEGGLATLLDQALEALIAASGAEAAAAWLLPDEPRPGGASAGDLELVRYQDAPPEAFQPPPPIDFLETNVPYVETGRPRLVAPLLLGTEVLGAIVLLGVEGREDLLRFVGQASAQLAVAVGNVRAYAAADRLASALKERNVALARQRDQLQEMNRLKSEFLASVSHELRTPLNAIIGYCELLTDGIYGDVSEAQKSALAGIDESGHNLVQLINQILDLAKVEAGKMTVHIEQVDIDELAQAVVTEAAALARDRPYKIGLYRGRRVRLPTDGAKVKQILTNLVSNAIKFTSKGRVDVRIRPEADGGCTIAVVDTGIGIRPEDMRIIFEEFRQVDGSYTRQFGGTGLGLALARKFASLVGGGIAVESKPGVGSTFSLRLPPEPPAATATPPEGSIGPEGEVVGTPAAAAAAGPEASEIPAVDVEPDDDVDDEVSS